MSESEFAESLDCLSSVIDEYQSLESHMFETPPSLPRLQVIWFDMPYDYVSLSYLHYRPSAVAGPFCPWTAWRVLSVPGQSSLRVLVKVNNQTLRLLAVFSKKCSKTCQRALLTKYWIITWAPSQNSAMGRWRRFRECEWTWKMQNNLIGERWRRDKRRWAGKGWEGMKI